MLFALKIDEIIEYHTKNPIFMQNEKFQRFFNSFSNSWEN